MFKQTVIGLAGAAAIGVGFAGSAEAAFLYPNSVENVNGTFGAPGALSSSETLAEATLGNPDGQFIQLSDNTELTLKFENILSGVGTLRVWTFDTLFPAAAKIEVSSDNSTFIELIPTASSPGFFDDSPTGFFDISLNIPSGFQFIKFTDLPGSIDGDDFAGGTLGFDLDAVGFQATSQPTPVPDPASILGLVTIGAVAAGGALKTKVAD